MVDESLPLRSLFLDLNAYFASVEQQEDPSLRNRPIAVVPMLADSTCVIAASYQAKAYGIKTGTLVGEAKLKCPELLLMTGRPALYAHYHQKVLDAVDRVLPVEKVASIDEMRFALIGEERVPAEAVRIAGRLKAAIREHVGVCMTSSIGIAPNGFLAKLGTDMRKPDGLVVIEHHQIPAIFEGLKLTDFVGINRRMEVRIKAAGIFTPMDLYAANPLQLRRAFGSIVGERWYYMLRGQEVEPEESDQKSLSHSHVLPPDLRSETGCREVLLRLISKAAARLRSKGLWAGQVTFYVRGFDRSWKWSSRMPPTHDTLLLNELFGRAWTTRDFKRPRGVGLAFGELTTAEAVTPSLFDGGHSREKFNEALDRVNKKFGKNSVFLAGMEHAKDTADEKIAFNKTWLFSEGKGDNEWVEPNGS